MSELPLCKWCEKNRVKRKKCKTCNRSCAALLRWEELGQTGRLSRFTKASEHAKKTNYYKRLRAEITIACKELGIEETPAIRKLYIRSRNRGYKNGAETGYKRGRRETRKPNIL